MYTCVYLNEHTFHAENFSDTNFHTGRQSPQQSKIQTSYINCTHKYKQHRSYNTGTGNTAKTPIQHSRIHSVVAALLTHQMQHKIMPKKIIKICINKNTIQNMCGRLMVTFEHFK